MSVKSPLPCKVTHFWEAYHISELSSSSSILHPSTLCPRPSHTHIQELPYLPSGTAAGLHVCTWEGQPRQGLTQILEVARTNWTGNFKILGTWNVA